MHQKIKRIFYIIISCLVIIGCDKVQITPVQDTDSRESKVDSKDSQSNYKKMIGRWEGQAIGKNNSIITNYLVEYYEDGEFQITFLNRYPKKPCEKSTEFGLWGVEGNILMRMTFGWIDDFGNMYKIRNRDNYFNDAYRIDVLTDTKSETYDFGDSDVYKMVKRSAFYTFDDKDCINKDNELSKNIEDENNEKEQKKQNYLPR